MSNCSECGKLYTDDDVAQDDAMIPQVEWGTCKHCVHQGLALAGSGDKRACKKLLGGDTCFVASIKGVNGLTVMISPNFSCAMFSFEGKS